MEESIKEILSQQIGLAEQLSKFAKEATFFVEECSEIKSKTEKLAALLLRMVDNPSSRFYERPTLRIINESQQALDQALSLVRKCKSKGQIKRMFALVSESEFRKTSAVLENSIGDVTWLIRICLPSEDEDRSEYLRLPPIAAEDPILSFIWTDIATLKTGSLEDRSDAAASLASLARDNTYCRRLIVGEGGAEPLLKLLNEGNKEAQINAARAIGLMGIDSESVENMIQTGVCKVFAKILKQGEMEVQAVVAWAVSELVANYPTFQDIFVQNNIVRLLINHLTFGVIQEDMPNVVVINKATSVHASVMTMNHLNASKAIEEYNDDNKPNQPQQQNVSLSSTSSTGGEVEVKDPETQAYMKAMAARALCNLLKGNFSVCRMIVESRALMGFVALLDKGNADVQLHSAMALMEITAVAEQDSDLRRATFRRNSPASKIVVDQLVKVLERGYPDDIIIPCIKAIGNLAKTFLVSETKIIAPLVKFLDDRAFEVYREAIIALTKFACKENYLHLEHSKTIVEAGAALHLSQLVFFGEPIDQVSALLLLSYIALHAPADCEKLYLSEVPAVLDWALKQASLTQDKIIESLVSEAKSRLERVQFSRSLRGV